MSDQQVKWRLPEAWSITRSDGRTVRLDLTQDGDTISGTARADGDEAFAGTMGGSTTADSIEMTIYWPAAAIARYVGAIDGDGAARGTVVSDDGSAAAVEWTAVERLSSWT
jgi:hypothetical protein